MYSRAEPGLSKPIGDTTCDAGTPLVVDGVMYVQWLESYIP